MRKLILGGMVALLLGGGGAVAAPGPNGHNDYGLCRAYFSGSENGQEHKQAKGQSFIALRTAAGDQDDDGDTDNDDVAAFCDGKTPGGR